MILCKANHPAKMFNVGKRLKWRVDDAPRDPNMEPTIGFEDYYYVKQHVFAKIRKEMKGLDICKEIERGMSCLAVENDQRIMLGVNMCKDRWHNIYADQYWIYWDDIDDFLEHLVKMKEPIKKISILVVERGDPEPDCGDSDYFAMMAERGYGCF